MRNTYCFNTAFYHIYYCKWVNLYYCSSRFCFLDEKRDGMEGGNIHGVAMDTLEAVTDEDLYSETKGSPHCSSHFSANW